MQSEEQVRQQLRNIVWRMPGNSAVRIIQNTGMLVIPLVDLKPLLDFIEAQEAEIKKLILTGK